MCLWFHGEWNKQNEQQILFEDDNKKSKSKTRADPYGMTTNRAKLYVTQRRTYPFENFAQIWEYAVGVRMRLETLLTISS